MRADDPASLFIPPNASGPTIGWHTGLVTSWDELTGSNTVVIEGTPFHDVRVLSTGAVTPLHANDVVGIMVIGTQPFILGKVRAVGAGLAERFVSNRVSALRAVPIGGAFADLATSYGPEVTINIGSGRRVWVVHSCEIIIAGGGVSSLERGTAWQAVQVSGASTLAVETAVTDAYMKAPIGTESTVTATTMVSSVDGLNAGMNTFTCKYKAIADGSLAPYVNNRTLTVIPF